MIVFYSL